MLCQTAVYGALLFRHSLYNDSCLRKTIWMCFISRRDRMLEKSTYNKYDKYHTLKSVDFCRHLALSKNASKKLPPGDSRTLFGWHLLHGYTVNVAMWPHLSQECSGSTYTQFFVVNLTQTLHRFYNGKSVLSFLKYSLKKKFSSKLLIQY